MSDLLKKAKAMAALEAGVTVYRCLDGEYMAIKPGGFPLRGYQLSAQEALAAACDALGLTPDPSLLSGGVLTEEDWSLIRQLVYEQACKTRYDYNMNRDLAQDDELEKKVEIWESLSLRLTEGGS